MRDYPSLARPPRRSIAAETQPTEPVSFDDDQLVHESRILEAASISHSTLWRMTKAGRVPPPVMLSDRTKRYFFQKTMAAIRAIEQSKGLVPVERADTKAATGTWRREPRAGTPGPNASEPLSGAPSC